MSQQSIQNVQKAIEAEMNEARKIQTELAKVMGSRQGLIEKRGENEMVLKELALLEPTAVLYKMVGPVLAKQSLSEAKSNVEKRVEFINGEM